MTKLIPFPKQKKEPPPPIDNRRVKPLNCYGISEEGFYAHEAHCGNCGRKNGLQIMKGLPLKTTNLGDCENCGCKL